MSVQRYKKKPIVIEAIQWEGTRASLDAICKWANHYADPLSFTDDNEINVEYLGDFLDNGELTQTNITVYTLEGEYTVNEGWYIIQGIEGEFYPCEPNIFEKTYDEVL